MVRPRKDSLSNYIDLYDVKEGQLCIIRSGTHTVTQHFLQKTLQ